jgi:hypothetical protein
MNDKEHAFFHRTSFPHRKNPLYANIIDNFRFVKSFILEYEGNFNTKKTKGLQRKNE